MKKKAKICSVKLVELFSIHFTTTNWKCHWRVCWHSTRSEWPLYTITMLTIWNDDSKEIILSTILWCRMVHNIIPSHTMYTLLKSKASSIATVCGYMKVAISASTEAFLCQKSKKEQHQQVVHLLTYSFPN